ncbi:MAG TPA: hypothetical protein VG733_06125 [Chthoniobacteraceae bacterium]|nr:hypothetical protein [Chthoniobacteraceae bacterium]
MPLPPKIVTVLCLVQCFFIVAGTLFIRTFLKAEEGLAGGAHGLYFPTNLDDLVPVTTLFLRSFGFWFLLVPLAWCATALLRGEVTNGEGAISRKQFIVGIVLTLWIMFLFTRCGWQAIHVLFGPDY